MKHLMIPETAEEALERWDGGEPVLSVKMGGLGPGYEQAIQTLVFEIIREHRGEALPEPGSDEARDWAWQTVWRADERLDLGGVTGAMAGHARSLAFRYLLNGYLSTIESAPDDRKIQVG